EGSPDFTIAGDRVHGPVDKPLKSQENLSHEKPEIVYNTTDEPPEKYDVNSIEVRKISSVFRGRSLIEDLKLLLKYQKYSDLEIICNDNVVLYGCKAFLAIRSETWEQLLFNKDNALSENKISFSKINSSAMKNILEYIHMGGLSEKSLTVENAIETFAAAEYFQLDDLLKNHVNKFLDEICNDDTSDNNNESPELLSKVVKMEFSFAESKLMDMLIDSVSRIPLDNLDFGRLPFEAFQVLLTKTCNYNKLFASSEYSVLRYSILLSAKEVSNESFSILKERLPTWNELCNNGFIPINKDFKFADDVSRISKNLEPLVDMIDLTCIDGKVLADLIEPLNIISSDKLMSAYKVHLRGSILPKFRGIQDSQILASKDVRWDIHECDQKIHLDNDGHVASINSDISYIQRAKTNYVLVSGIHECKFVIEKLDKSVWIGVCSEYCRLSENNEWTLGSDGFCHHNDDSIKYFSKEIVEGTKITVHVDMDKRTCAFSINGKKHSPVTSWTDFPSRLRFVALLHGSSQLLIFCPRISIISLLCKCFPVAEDFYFKKKFMSSMSDLRDWAFGSKSDVNESKKSLV
ncbi:9594_t:CDS:2, partial [Acaulospora morrowiae]